MQLRLANKADITEDMCTSVLEDAYEYLRDNPGDKCTAIDILNVFVRFAEGKAIDPQFWLYFKELHYAGYLISRCTMDDGISSLYIAQGFILPAYRANGIAEDSLKTVEEFAKRTGYKTIRLKTLFDPKVYTRWIGKYGYKYRATEFIKEI